MRLQYILFCLGALLLVSCYDDEGNYDYHNINEIKVVGGMDEEYSAYTMVDTLKISPVLSFTEDSTTTGRFEYSWYVAKADYGSGKLTKISNQKDLVYPVNLPRETYVVLFKVKDLVTDVEWSAKTYLYVTTLFTNGWLLLGEKNGNIAVDMISISTVGDTILLKDILKSSGLPALKGPRKMISINRPDNIWAWTGGCFLMTDEGTYELDKVSMTSDATQNILKDLYDPEVSSEFAGSDMIQHMGNYRFLIGDNTLYVNSSLSSSATYGNPVNKYSKYSTEYFKVFPEIIWGFNSWGYFSGSQMVYDMDHKRFAKFRSSSVNCDTLPDNKGDDFEWKTGNEMIAIFNSKFLSSGTQTSYAIMKSPDSRYYIYSFQPAVATGPKKGGKFDITDLPGINQATKFAFSGRYPYMLYVVGSKLHACEFLTTGITHKEFDEFDGDEITMLHFDNYKESGKDFFYIATYNEQDGGTVRKYQLKDDPNVIQIERIGEDDWTGLCKVTSMCWKWY